MSKKIFNLLLLFLLFLPTVTLGGIHKPLVTITNKVGRSISRNIKNVRHIPSFIYKKRRDILLVASAVAISMLLCRKKVTNIYEPEEYRLSLIDF